MNKYLISLATAALLFVSNLAGATDDFKGQARAEQFTVGALTGLAIIDSRAAFPIIGTLGRKIFNAGFVADINNSVWIEGAFGPAFLEGSSVFLYGVHLRWDFEKDTQWTFFALGGFAGNIAGSKLGDRTEFYPRFGVGALWRLDERFAIRGEVSHEWSVAGVEFEF